MALCLAMSASASNAVTGDYGGGDCALSQVTQGTLPGGPFMNVVACVDEVEGNDAIGNNNGGNVDLNNPLPPPTLLPSNWFGLTDWYNIDRVNAPNTDNNDAGKTNVLELGYDSGGRKTGTWEVDAGTNNANLPIGTQTLMLVLKDGFGFAAYLLDLTKALEGTWNTAGLTSNSGGSNPDISHITLYGSTSLAVVDPIPLPAGAFLLLTGLGVAAAVRRKRA